MAPHPRYARYSPDTPSDESSEEDLPNFTLLSEESILPEGSKRVRTQKVPLIFDDAPASPPKRVRRARRGQRISGSPVISEDDAQPNSTSRISSYPSKQNRELSIAPRKFKRRRIVDESPSPDIEDESGMFAISRDEDEEEEPIRSMPLRRSAKLPSTTPSETSGSKGIVQARETSSDLSSPPESDTETEEFHQSILKSDTHEDIEAEQEDDDDRGFNNCKLEEEERSVLNQHVDNDPTKQQPPLRTEAESPATRMDRQFARLETTASSDEKLAVATNNSDKPLGTIKLQSISQLEKLQDAPVAKMGDVTISTIPIMSHPEYLDDEKRDNMYRTHEKREHSVTMNATSAINERPALARKKKTPVIKTKPLTSAQRPLLPLTKSPQLLVGKTCPTQDTPLPVSDSPRRVKEISGTSRPTSMPPAPPYTNNTRPPLRALSSVTRPASTSVLLSATPSQPSSTIRGHTRHRSMDIASLLNNDEPPPLPTTLSTQRAHPSMTGALDFLVPDHQQMLQFPAATESFLRSSPAPNESFIRSRSAPQGQLSLISPNATPIRHTFAQSPSPLVPDAPDRQ